MLRDAQKTRLHWAQRTAPWSHLHTQPIFSSIVRRNKFQPSTFLRKLCCSPKVKDVSGGVEERIPRLELTPNDSSSPACSRLLLGFVLSCRVFPILISTQPSSPLAWLDPSSDCTCSCKYRTRRYTRLRTGRRSKGSISWVTRMERKITYRITVVRFADSASGKEKNRLS